MSLRRDIAELGAMLLRTKRRIAVTAVVAATVVLLPAAFAIEDNIITGSIPRLTTLELAPPPIPPPVDIPTVDLALIRRGLEAYRRGDLAGGDAVARETSDRGGRAALEWAALRSNSRGAGFQRITTFLDANPGFPMASWLRRRAEDALFAERSPAARVLAFFGARTPEMASGKAALATVLIRSGESARAIALVRSAWRENVMPADVGAYILETFPNAITPADHRFRAERLIYKDQAVEGVKIAGKAGPEGLLVARVLAAAVDERDGLSGLLAGVPPSIADAPGVRFARIQQARRTGDIATAAWLMLTAPHDKVALVDPDAWWAERRLVTRKLLDLGDARTAYAVASGHDAVGDAARVEAEWHAGWIALRFLSEPARAKGHFEEAARVARLPVSLSRAQYWLGRASEAAGDPGATDAYQAAARFPFTYYGQLARARLGLDTLPVAGQDPPTAALDGNLGGQAIRILFEAQGRDFAAPLLTDFAQTSTDAAAQDALGAFVAARGEAKLLLGFGKTALQRGVGSVRHAFPTIGVPAYAPLEGSADKAMVYAIARQESEFDANAVSSAGARGLMQMMPATAQRTAQKFRQVYDAARLTSDPVFNATLGAAHLGELLVEQRGSSLLTFAAYNAGGGRVRDWVVAYGDPRTGRVDPVDWAERIPFTETRNYVQRVMENMQVYRARLDKEPRLTIEADLVGPSRRRVEADLSGTRGLAVGLR